MTKPLRQSMPWVTSIIDDFRANFPEAQIEKTIRSGIDGQPTFYAKENGQEIGTRVLYDATKAVKLSDTTVGPMNAVAAQSANQKGK